MNKQVSGSAAGGNKNVAITTLRIVSIIIIVLGVVFMSVSFIKGLTIPLLGYQVHGGIFGAVIALIGVWYFSSVSRLKAEAKK